MEEVRQLKRLKPLWFLIAVVLMAGFIWGSIPTLAMAEDNSSTVPGNASNTTDAYYYSDQYMWKVSLFVAKSDTVNKGTSTMDDFYRIGNQAVYLNPVNNASEWYGGARPSQVTQMFFTKENKVDTLKELKNKGGNVNALDPVDLATGGGVYMMLGVPNLPYVPQLSDGNVFDNGVIQGGTVGNIQTTIDYFNNPETMFELLNFYAGKQGISRDALVKNMAFTINGETKTNWNPNSILPNAMNGNSTNQVEWLVVYEPVSIIYVANTAKPGSYYGYVLTATDFALSQIKHQMDWRYDETRKTEWTGLQPDSWKANGDRQHVAKLSHLILGNSILTTSTWYGLESGSAVNQDAPVPNNRWTSENELKYGGWGMTRWIKPTTYAQTKDYEFRPNTDVVIACPVYSQYNLTPGSEITVKYEINGETYTDKILSPEKRVSDSYFKWHTPDVDTVTEYSLKISVSPYPNGTIQNGSEYIVKKVIIRPLTELTPPDPKVDDKRPTDLPNEVVPPNPPVTDDTPEVGETAKIISVKELSTAPYHMGQKVTMEVKTNMASQTLDFKNIDTGDIKQFTEDSMGNGILVGYTKIALSNVIIWKVEFTPRIMGINHYSFTPTNTQLGAGQSVAFGIEAQKMLGPEIISIIRSPADAEVNPKEPMTITIQTNATTDYITMHSVLKDEMHNITPVTNFGDEDVRGNNKKMDVSGDSKVDAQDKSIEADHVAGVCKGTNIPCGICGAQDIDNNGVIDANDVKLISDHINGNCSVSDCYFHGIHENRVAKDGGWEWTVTYFPNVSGNEILTFIPYGTGDFSKVNGISKTLSFIVKNPGRSLIEIFPDAGFAEDIRVTMNATRSKPINTIYEKVVIPEDLLSVTHLVSPNAKAITGISELQNLILLNISDGNKITVMPAEIGLNTKLEVLYASNESLTTLPTAIGNLKALKIMHINGSKITSLPTTMGGLTALWNFNVSNNLLTALPSELGDATALTSLVANGNQITAIPDNFSKLQGLTECNFADNKLADISALYTRIRNYGAGWNFNRQIVAVNVSVQGNSAHTDIGDPGMNTPEILRDMYQSYQNFDYNYQTSRGVPAQLYMNVRFYNNSTGATWANGTDMADDYTFNQQRLIASDVSTNGTSVIQSTASWFDGSTFTFNYTSGSSNPNNVERAYNTGSSDSGSFNIAIRGYPGATSFPTWSEMGGQDDIVWYSTSNSANFYVDSNNHNSPALYSTHIYNGSTGLGAKQYKVSQAMHDGFSGMRLADHMRLTVKNPRCFGGLLNNKVYVAIWNDGNGQDDICWLIYDNPGDGNAITGHVYNHDGINHAQGGNYHALFVAYGFKGIGFPNPWEEGLVLDKVCGEITF